jgi:hypothetical protein
LNKVFRFKGTGILCNRFAKMLDFLEINIDSAQLLK